MTAFESLFPSRERRDRLADIIVTFSGFFEEHEL